MNHPPEPQRSQSTTSLSRLYNGSTNGGNRDAELSDPGLDYCNAFWGQGEKGFEVIMARLRGATRTTEELRSFWKERAAIEEDYAKRLAKLSKTTLGRDEIGDTAASLQNVLVETSQQASYHMSLSTEIKQTVEQPTAEFQSRLTNLKKGLQSSVEKSYRNKGLQEGHVQKAKEKYESDCLKLNSYTANMALSQGKELEKVQSKVERVRQTIGGNEQDFRQFVKVLEGTTQKWEAEWRGFCDHVQDLEEDRMVMMKDIMWAFANAVSQVCVEDDGACERIREKLETFEPANDMVAFVRGWGTGDQIPDPPRFINYSAGEYPQQPSSHPARFQRLSSKPPLSAVPRSVPDHGEQQEEEAGPEPQQEPERGAPNGLANGMQSMSLQDQAPPPISSPQQAQPEASRAPFGGVAMPGMGAAALAAGAGAGAGAMASNLPERNSSMGPPPVPPTMTMPEPRVPSRQGPPSPSSRDVNDESDPMARALAELRREPPGSGSIRRGASHRRPESVASGSVRAGIHPSASPGPGQGQQRMSYQQPPPSQGQGHGGPGRQQSIDMTLSPPAPGHTAAQLARSMDEFHRSASRAADKRGSVNYSNYADDVVGAHPSSRPNSPGPISPSGNRSPSPAMMQAPIQPATHIADEVLSQYHQSFPGERRERERSRSRAGSVISAAGSRPGSVMNMNAAPPQQQGPPASPRAGFVGIGAGGGRSPSPGPGPPARSPVNHTGALGPQSLGIALDKSGGVAHDSMAEAYRRQYQEEQQQRPGSQYDNQPPSQYGQSPAQGQSQGQVGQPARSPSAASFGGMPNPTQRPTSGYGGLPQGQQGQQGYGQQGPPPQQFVASPPPQSQAQYQQYQAQPPQPSYQTRPSYQQQPPPQQQPPYMQNGYDQQQQPQFAQPPPQHQHSYGRSASPAPPSQTFGRSASPAPGTQAGGYGRSASPAPQQQQQQQQYGYRAPSPQPQVQAQQSYRAPSPQPQVHQQQQQQQAYNRTPSPQPGPGYGGQVSGRSPSPQPNQPPPNTAPTGQWSTTGLPVLFYVKALYDYAAQSSAEFDFQSGDIIAVTSTPEDGWWSGELLDEARRLPGRTDFPSNFVCLF